MESLGYYWEHTACCCVQRGLGVRVMYLGECYGASESTESTERSDREWARIVLGHNKLVSEPSSSHRRDFGGERKPISESDQILRAQKWRLSIPLDSSRRNEAPALNEFQIGVQTSPQAPFEVRRVRSTHPTCARGRRRLDFTRHAPPRAQELTHAPARAPRQVQQPSTRANAPARARRVAAIRRHVPTRSAEPIQRVRAEPLTRAALSRAIPRQSLSRSRDYNGGTSERVPEATGRGQKKWPEKRSQEGGHRGQEKRSKKRYRQMMADGKIQKSHFKCFYCDQEGQEELSKKQSTRLVFRGSNNSNDGCG
ncbi:hypothetical protein Acr_06g0017010 [Actinidia rufa]|uniref:Uncharacterized protein n=1 Tax=Actinidia rufa TaxID=165716 RepID=A0A7J0ETE9_9ERIC|nr:hypothetical protein Acr_06g0017010 [Actinidia rufa]